MALNDFCQTCEVNMRVAGVGHLILIFEKRISAIKGEMTTTTAFSQSPIDLATSGANC